mmetsp:Transcript_68473/g.200291  ORF Transcript_68473/g.200291 Transcript_68473/m.200291 type:complete len:285 (-) Transcript_68473:567-1421(-)
MQDTAQSDSPSASGWRPRSPVPLAELGGDDVFAGGGRAHPPSPGLQLQRLPPLLAESILLCRQRSYTILELLAIVIQTAAELVELPGNTMIARLRAAHGYLTLRDLPLAQCQFIPNLIDFGPGCGKICRGPIFIAMVAWLPVGVTATAVRLSASAGTSRGSRPRCRLRLPHANAHGGAGRRRAGAQASVAVQCAMQLRLRVCRSLTLRGKRLCRIAALRHVCRRERLEFRPCNRRFRNLPCIGTSILINYVFVVGPGAALSSGWKQLVFHGRLIAFSKRVQPDE